jgi:DNA-binding transcriptional MerR regulator
MIGVVTIGQLAARTGLSVRTLRFYADSGVLPEAGRADSGYRLFSADAVARARLVRTLRELGVGLDDVKRVLSAEASLADVASAHARALDAQIRTLRLQRAVLRAVARSTDPEELERMTDLTTLTAEERRRIVDDYLDAVFGDARGAVAEKIRIGAPELPDDPTADQVAAWIELVELLRDPDYIATSRRMAERALAEGPPPDPWQFELGKAVGEQAGAAVGAGIAPDSPEALRVIAREGVSAATTRAIRRPAPPPQNASKRSTTGALRAIGRSWRSSTAGRSLRPRLPLRCTTRGNGTPTPSEHTGR